MRRLLAFLVLPVLFPVAANAQAPAAKGPVPAAEDAKKGVAQAAYDFHAELDAALDEYNAAVEAEIEEIAKALDVTFQKATQSGNLELAKKAQDAERRLREHGEPPSDTFMRTARSAAQRNINRAAHKLKDRYQAVAKMILKTGDVQGAEAVHAEAREIVTNVTVWQSQSQPPAVQSRRTPSRRSPRTTTFTFRSEQDIEKYGSLRNDDWQLEGGGVRFTEFRSKPQDFVSKQAYDGDFVVEATYVDGSPSYSMISLHACGTSFSGRGGSARLERRGNALRFTSTQGKVQEVTLKQDQHNSPTRIGIGQEGKILLQGVRITGTPAETE